MRDMKLTAPQLRALKWQAVDPEVMTGAWRGPKNVTLDVLERLGLIDRWGDLTEAGKATLAQAKAAKP